MSPRVRSRLSLVKGITNLPGFGDSLRLLVERERYSYKDIALMFGVSFQCVQQWCNARSIHHPDRALSRGMNAYRVWDDSRHCFAPVSRAAVTAKRKSAGRARRWAARADRRANRQFAIVRRLVALSARLGREPSWLEMALDLGIMNANGSSACARVIGRFDTSSASTPEKVRRFREATGIRPRGAGGAGHVAPRRPRSASISLERESLNG